MAEIFNQIKKITFNSPTKPGIARKSVVYKSFLNIVRNLRITFRFLRCKKATLDLIFSQFILASFLVTILKILFFQFFQTHKVLLFLILIIIISFAIKFNFRERIAQHLRNIYYHVGMCNFEFSGFFSKIPRIYISGYTNIDFLLCFFVRWVWRLALLLRFLIDSNSYIRILYITFIFVATLVPNVNFLVLILSFILSLAQLILYVNIFTYTKLYKNYIIYDATEVMNLKICRSNLALFYSVFILLLQDKVKDESGIIETAGVTDKDYEKRLHKWTVRFGVFRIVHDFEESFLLKPLNQDWPRITTSKDYYEKYSLPFILLESKNEIKFCSIFFSNISLMAGVGVYVPPKIKDVGIITKIQNWDFWKIKNPHINNFAKIQLEKANSHPITLFTVQNQDWISKCIVNYTSQCIHGQEKNLKKNLIQNSVFYSETSLIKPCFIERYKIEAFTKAENVWGSFSKNTSFGNLNQLYALEVAIFPNLKSSLENLPEVANWLNKDDHLPRDSEKHSIQKFSNYIYEFKKNPSEEFEIFINNCFKEEHSKIEAYMQHNWCSKNDKQILNEKKEILNIMQGQMQQR